MWEGKSVKFLMSAGRWKTAKMPMQRYGHLEQSEVNDEVGRIASDWAESTKRTLWRWESPQVQIAGRSLPDEPLERFYDGPLLLVTIGNGISSGGMFRLTPQASITDGLLDVCLVQAVSKSRILQVIPRVIQGAHASAQEVHVHRVTTITISADAGLPVHADGEILARHAQNIEINVVSGGLSVLKPV